MGLQGPRHRRIAAWSTAVVLAMAVVPTGAIAGTTSSTTPGLSPRDPIPSEGLLEPNGPGTQEETRLTSPEAVRAREESAMVFAGLSPHAAEAVLSETDPRTVDEPDGGPPSLPAGQTATGFPSDYAMTIDLGAGKSALVESLAPLAIETEPGKRVPLDLSLREADGGFQPTRGIALVRFGQQASEGASLLDTEVSLTPVGEDGAPLNGSGAIDHASVFYGGTEDERAGIRDLGLLAKPTVDGFELNSVLFSQRSPEHLYFKVGLPAGATLVQAGSGEVRVLREGVPIAAIPRPSARDAEGTFVPVSMSLAGSTIELTVPRSEDQVRYPLIVDPTVEDTTIPTSSKPYGSNWEFASEPAGQLNSTARKRVAPRRRPDNTWNCYTKPVVNPKSTGSHLTVTAKCRMGSVRFFVYLA
jgi:hypothetical protein